jgi:paraquat-inducible protein B
MSKQANKTVIGIFVLGAIALIVAGIALLGSGRFFKETFTAVCFFEGSVGGLNEGAPVVFRGVKVGSVKKIQIVVDPKDQVFRIPVFVEIEPYRIETKGPRSTPGENLKDLIARGLRARLEMQSILTGQLQVSLDSYPGKPANFVGTDPKYPEIPTVPTPFQELAKKVEKIPIDEIFEKIRSALEGIEKVVNSPDITHTLHSISQAAEDVKVLVKNVNTQVAPLGPSIQETLKDVQKLVRGVDGEIKPLALNVDETLKDVRKLVQNLDGKIDPLSASIDGGIKDIQKLIRNIDDKATVLATTLDETAREAKGVIRHIDHQIEPLASTLQETLRSADATLRLAEKAIQQMASRVDETIGEDSPLLYELNRTLEEISSLARSIRVLADHLERHPESVIRGK